MSLSRVLGVGDLVLLIVGVVIGSGIYLVPGPVLRQVNGNVGLAILVWLAGGVLSMLGALTYGEMSANAPRAGGLYVFIRDAFGRLPAFLYGWTLFFVICGGSTAALAVAFATYLGEIVPLGPGGSKAVAVAMIVVVAGVNIMGTRRSANLQNWTTAIKVSAIVAMSFVLLWLGSGLTPGLESPMSLLTGQRAEVSDIGLAMIGVLWAYEGWQYCTFSAGEVIDPQRDYPRALLLGSVALIFIYILANMGYISALGTLEASNSNSIATAAMGSVLGPWAARLITLAILVSMFSAANGMTLTATRVYYAMADDRVFFRKLAEVHPRFGTPAFAIFTGSGWAVLLALTGTFEQLLTYVVFSGWIFYALGASSLFFYRRRLPTEARPYKVPGYPWTPLLFIAAAIALVINTVLSQPGRAAVGLAIVLSGAPAYFIWTASQRVSQLNDAGSLVRQSVADSQEEATNSL